MANPVDAEERQKIIDLLHEHGGNRTKVARIVKRSNRTVQTIAEQEGIASTHVAPKKAIEAHKVFSEEARREAVILGFEKYKELLEKCRDAQDLQRLAVALGILVDKDLLLAGKPTSINESRKGNEVGGLFAELKGKADEQWSK